MNLFKNEPQHNKFYLPNANQKTILIYDGIRWLLTSTTPILNDINNTHKDYIIYNYEELTDKLPFIAIDKLDQFIIEMDNPDSLNLLIDAVRTILKNFRSVVESTKQEIINNKKKYT